MLNTTNPNNYEYTTKHLEISILGGIKLNHLEALRVTLGIKKPEQHNVLRHNVDLYNDNQVEKLVRKVAERIEIGTSVVRRTLQELTNELEQYRLSQLDNDEQETTIKELTGAELRAAEAFLKKKDLLQRTNRLIEQSGVIGEETNRLLMYLIFTSRKSYNPLHCISLGTSGSGKTHLQSKVAELIPDHEKVEITVLSENAFYYFNRTELRNKLILIEDLDGAESVLYPLRELQSKRRITKTVVHKDRKGNTKTIHLTVEGPVSVAGCTTQESIYEDNSNRSFLLYIDESSEQDQKIMYYQRLISAGKVNVEKEYQARQCLQNVQMVLQSVKVINPYAEFLELPQSVFKPRRTNTHYLQFIEAITFYKQYQREKQYDQNTGEEYIETTTQDIQEANEIIKEVLLHKSDTITGACRNHLERLKSYLKENTQTTFTNAEIRRNLRVKETTLRRYNKQLLEEGYIKRIKNAKTKSYCFEIVDLQEYDELKDQIDKALQNCITQIELASSPPSRHTSNNETKSKKAS
ncbi:hypothetical protein [Aquimarina macrocephali]|uniref:hypothetical protein n=1 Tax=Aquimarina macrocephali TaxID=666563 RepID=UPI003F66EFFA